MGDAKLFLFFAAATAMAALPAGAGERVSMQTAPSGIAPENGVHLKVSGANGRYERLETSSGIVPLDFRAEVLDGDTRIKILKSRVYLKSEGAPADAESTEPDAAGLEDGPARRIDAKKIALGTLASNGPTAQDAIAACNRLSAAERNQQGGETVLMSLPVVWQVTTGRFSFNWKNYDRVGPSDEIVKNIDFYRDREEAKHETSITAAVECVSLGEAAVAKATEPEKSVPAKVTAKATPKAKGKTAAADKAEAPAPQADDAKPVKTALVEESAKPRCDGGMVRETSSASGYLCLCPGNTTRVDKGDNGFACVRRRQH